MNNNVGFTLSQSKWHPSVNNVLDKVKKARLFIIFPIFAFQLWNSAFPCYRRWLARSGCRYRFHLDVHVRLSSNVLCIPAAAAKNLRRFLELEVRARFPRSNFGPLKLHLDFSKSRADFFFEKYGFGSLPLARRHSVTHGTGEESASLWKTHGTPRFCLASTNTTEQPLKSG